MLVHLGSGLTSRVPRAVMPRLSQPLVRQALLASLAAGLSFARPALAQIPVYTPPDAAPAEPAAIAPPQTVTPLPASAPPAAKAVVISQPRRPPAVSHDDEIDDTTLQAQS